MNGFATDALAGSRVTALARQHRTAAFYRRLEPASRHDAERLRDELVDAVASFNESIDPEERVRLMSQIRDLRAQLRETAG